MKESERIFYENFKKDTGFDLEYEPCRFVLKDGLGHYTPDFLCVETSTYYEVSASRQAYYERKKKIKALMAKHPLMKFIVVNPNGTLYLNAYSKQSMSERAIRLMYEIVSRHCKRKDAAKAMGISEPYLSLLISGKRKPSYKIAKRIESLIT